MPCSGHRRGTRLSDLGVPLIAQKNDVEIGPGVEQRRDGPAHLPGQFLAIPPAVPQQAEHHAAGLVVIHHAREVGPGHGGVQTEQDGQRLLEALLRRAVLFPKM